MSLYALRVPDPIADLVRNLHPSLKSKVGTAFRTLSADPCVGKALKDELLGLRSYRVARFRIVYRIVANRRVIEIVAVGPRKTIYEQAFRILAREAIGATGRSPLRS